ncbi:MAG: hypothetical protein AB7L90_25820 [Hyphomicrobiaceae bacterium]
MSNRLRKAFLLLFVAAIMGFVVVPITLEGMIFFGEQTTRLRLENLGVPLFAHTLKFWGCMMGFLISVAAFALCTIQAGFLFSTRES